MKHITKFSLGALMLALSLNTFAFGPNGGQSTCGSWYITSNAGWSNSEYYKIIDIDAGTLTDAALPKFTSADGSKNAADTDFNTGHFVTPVMTTTDGTVYTPINVSWPVNYYMAAFAPTMVTSAKSKVNNGLIPSGSTCYANDNSVFQSAIYDKPGFIELSRLGSLVAKTPPSRHGYIQIDSLPQVERIKWSYSSTSLKRGVKMDINYNDGNGWIPQRWVASDYNNYEGSFSEQGYQFEEMVNKQEDPNSFISIRIRIWDGDSIHMKVNANDLTEQAVPYSATMVPYDQKQTVRVHQIQVFSGVIPTTAPSPKPIVSGTKNIMENMIKWHKSGNEIVLTEMADVQLYTIDGRQIFSGNTNKIATAQMAKGIYIIKASNNQGEMSSKIVL